MYNIVQTSLLRAQCSSQLCLLKCFLCKKRPRSSRSFLFNYFYKLMIFKPHKIENKSNAGTMYFNKMLKMKYRTLLPLTISSEGFTSQPTIKQSKQELTGNKTVELAKSKRSKNVLPMIFISLNKPNERVQGINKTIIIALTIMVAFCLVIFKLSLKAAIDVSSIAIEEVNAANSNNTKNRTAMRFPQNGSCSKTSGKVTKTKPGPSPGFKPYVNTAGKIIKPAEIAINVSPKIMM